MIISFFGRPLGFVAILGLVILLAPIPQANANFQVCDDSFSISNSPGYCFAMAAFSRWYYLMHQGEPPLRKILDKRSQQIIAREIQSYYSKNLIALQAEYCNKYHDNQKESFKRFAEGLIKGEPRIVLLMNKGPKGAILHAVLAYEYVPDQNVIKVYDPNYTSEERIIDLERKEYMSLDITYNAICFPEVLHHNPALVRKMEGLYGRYIERKLPATMATWRRAAAGPGDKYRYLKGEGNSGRPPK
jgi:hypothetical protein